MPFESFIFIAKLLEFFPEMVMFYSLHSPHDKISLQIWVGNIKRNLIWSLQSKLTKSQKKNEKAFLKVAIVSGNLKSKKKMKIWQKVQKKIALHSIFSSLLQIFGAVVFLRNTICPKNDLPNKNFHFYFSLFM